MDISSKRVTGIAGYGPAKPDKRPRQRIGYVILFALMKAPHSKSVLAATASVEHQDMHGIRNDYVGRHPALGEAEAQDLMRFCALASQAAE